MFHDRLPISYAYMKSVPQVFYLLRMCLPKSTSVSPLVSHYNFLHWLLSLQRMDAFVSLEENLEHAPKTIDFMSAATPASEASDKVLSTQIVGREESRGDEDDDEDENDAYELHQSKRLAEQFDMVDEEPRVTNPGSTASTTDTGSYFQTAVQRVRQRIQQRQQLKEQQQLELSVPANLSEEKTQTQAPVDEDFAPTQTILTEASTKFETGAGVDDDDGNDDDNYDDDDDDEEIVRPKQKHKAPARLSEDEEQSSDETTHPPTQPTQPIAETAASTSLTSLFVAENQSEEDNDCDADIPSEDELSSKIENYHTMSKEQRFLARKLERSKLRAAKALSQNSEKETYLTSSRKHLIKSRQRKGLIEKNKSDVLKKQELLRQNELLKRSIAKDPVIEPTKFSKSKLLNSLKLGSDSESDNDNEGRSSNNNSEHLKTPPTSPQKEEKKSFAPNIVRTKSSSTDKVIDLGSASDSDHADDIYHDGDDENEGDISIDKKTKMLDVKLFFSKKKKLKLEKKKKATLTEKIRKFNAKQLKVKISSLTDGGPSKDADLTDETLAKMLLEEQMKNSKSRTKQLEEEKKSDRQKDLLRSGEFPSHDDDPEFSDYSSDYEVSSDDSANYDLGIDSPPKEAKDVLTETNQTNDDAISLTQNIPQSGDFQLTQTDALQKFNLSFTQLFNNSPAEQTDDRLTTLEKFQKMRDNNNGVPLEQTQETNDSTIEHNRFLNETSFLTKQLQKDEVENYHYNAMETDMKNEIHHPVHLKDILDSQNLVLETQVDSLDMSTQQLDAPLGELSTQAVSVSAQVSVAPPPQELLLTQHDTGTDLKSHIRESSNDVPDIEDDDDDDDDDEKIKRGRKLQMKDDLDNKSAAEDEKEEEEETQEMRLKRIEMIKAAKKKERKLRRQREKEFKSKGLGQMMENEAVESDDEYHGTGGVDRDLSDEENSEDEKLIDDASNVHVDENELRRIQLEKDLKEDQEKVSKTYKDVKTHKLAERRAKDGVYAVDLSDDDEVDENDQLYRWREFIKKRKLKERKEFLEKNKMNIAEDDPKKPFFDAMAVNLPSHISIYKDSFPNTPSVTASIDENIIDQSNNILANDYDDQNPPSKKRKIKSKIYSFGDDDDIRFSSFKDQEFERARGDVLSDDDEDDDVDGAKELKRLKKKTSVHLHRKLRASKIPPPRAAVVEYEPSELESLSLLSSTSSSITASFKKATEKKVKISANTGNIIREVNVTTSPKTVTNSRAAVTKLASTELVDSESSVKRVVKGSGVDRLDKMLARTRKLGIKKLTKGR